MIGTGASAAQFVPEIAEPAAHLTILQRTPAWFLPTPDYRDDVEPEVAWLLQNVPGYTNWLRFWNFWQNVEGLMVAARVDPEWDNGGASVSQVNELIRQLFAQHLQAELAERPDLLPAVMPDYPPFSKRFIRDDGAWARTIVRDDVDLVTSPIAEITPEGVRTEDGTVHEADVLIYGTGFTASDFLMPMRIVGRDGVELHDQWKGDARAYLGITLPGLPEPVPALRPEHQHRRERQHHLLLRVRGAPRGRLHRGAAARGRQGARAHPGGPRRVQRGGRRREPPHGLGRVLGEHLVQERHRPHGPELAVQPPRVLAAHPRPRPRRLPAPPLALDLCDFCADGAQKSTQIEACRRS